MVSIGKNKNELLALTGAIYSFIAYLTAFTLEILFIIDLAKKNESLISATTAITTLATDSSTYQSNSSSISPLEYAKLTFESMQAHVTISCLAISVLYFVLFVASIILIISLILKSTLFILIWMCITTIMYLPEFSLVIYVSIYGWGINTRNGQTELIFYLVRATLNVIFLFRSYRLFKNWSCKKNFFKLKSTSQYSGYESPYFINDTLTTTINPIFSSSTLNLNRYDQIRQISIPPSVDDALDCQYHHRDGKTAYSVQQDNLRRKHRNSNFGLIDEVVGQKTGSCLSNSGYQGSPYQHPRNTSRSQSRQDSILSTNDNDLYTDFELDLDYRTLTRPGHSAQQNDSTTVQYQGSKYIEESTNYSQTGASTRSEGGKSYSTQSLDRRQLKDMEYSLPEHVILRPLGHQPFDYLRRLGSSSNLNSNSEFIQHSSYSSTTKLAKINGLDTSFS